MTTVPTPMPTGQAADDGLPMPRRSPLRRLSAWLHAHRKVRLGLLLATPLGWLVIVYLGSLAALLIQSFFGFDDFSGQVVYALTLRSYAELLTNPANLDIIFRTVSMAAAVTLGAALIGFPIAYLMARYATGRAKALFYLAVMLPLWSSYLVRVYAWKLILAKEGIVSWAFAEANLGWLLNGVLTPCEPAPKNAAPVPPADVAMLAQPRAIRLVGIDENNPPPEGLQIARGGLEPDGRVVSWYRFTDKAMAAANG